jgi:hypothetical protein
MRHALSLRFSELLKEMDALHIKKGADYGLADDPFSNVRATEEWGQPAWVGAMIRATDKMRRLQKVAQGGTLSNESARDSFLDLAVYALIGLVLYEEGSHPDSAPYKRGYVRAATVNNDDDSDTVPF